MLVDDLLDVFDSLRQHVLVQHHVLLTDSVHVTDLAEERPQRVLAVLV